MLTLRKLSSLPDGTRRRKLPLVVREFEERLVGGKSFDRSYLKGLMGLVFWDSFWPQAVQNPARMVIEIDEGPELLRTLKTLRHELLNALGRDWADWDMRAPLDDFSVEEYRRGAKPLKVFLDGLRSPFNVGSVIRTAAAFHMESLWVSPDSTSPNHPRARRSSMGTVDVLPWITMNLSDVDSGETGVVFALELGGENLETFKFPDNGTVILGSEELGVSPAMLDRAHHDGGVVTIPLPGTKASLNVGVAFGILAQKWVWSLS